MTAEFSTCPRCNSSMKKGFMVKAAGLSWVSPEKLGRVVFLDEDLSKAGFKKYLPAKAQYFRSYLCDSCQLYLVDYHETLSYDQAKDAAASLR